VVVLLGEVMEHISGFGVWLEVLDSTMMTCVCGV